MGVKRTNNSFLADRLSCAIDLCLLGVLAIAVVWAAAPAHGQSPPKEKQKQVEKPDSRAVIVGSEKATSEAIKEWPGRSKRFALIIGVDAYQEIGSLRGAVKDAQLLADVLKKFADFPKEQIILLTSDSPDEKNRPSRTNILRQLEDLRQKVPRDGMLLVSFAGHGIEGSDRQTYLLPLDAATGSQTLLKDTGISVESLKERILATGVKQVVLILDNCRSDPGERSGEGPRLSEDVALTLNFDVKNREVNAFVTLFATSPKQSAYEDKQSGHGYFTRELANALEGEAANLDGEVTLGRLIKYLEKKVPERVRRDLGRQQVPYVRYDGYKIDDLIIASSSPTLNLDELADRPFEDKLTGGKPKSFHFKPPAGHYVNLEIGGMDVGVTLFAPDGKEILRVDDQDETQGFKSILLIADVSANYRLEIVALTKDATESFYRVRRAAFRHATPEDKDRLNAQRAMLEASQALGKQKWQEAIDKYVEAAKSWEAADDRYGQGKALRSVGDLYNSLGKRDQALETYRQALVLFTGAGARNEQVLTLTLISRLYLSLDNKDPKETAEAKNKALEHLDQVADVLKLDLVARAHEKTRYETALTRLQGTSAEKEQLKRYQEIADRLAGLGKERSELLAKKNRTNEEEQRLAKLASDLADTNDYFKKFLDELSKEVAGTSIQPKVDSLRESGSLKSTLRDLGDGTVALYTVMGEDKYRILLVTPDVQIAREYSIKSADLSRKILAFRHALQNPRIDPRPLGQELYQILVGPVARDLEAAKAETLMWSLDGTLRYVPLSALYDGKKYLVERYRNVIFTPASVANLKDEPRPSASLRVLGLGVSKPQAEFAALPGVAQELHEIIKQSEAEGLLPGRVLLDEAFTAAGMQSALRERYPIVHIASHFQFRPGDPSDSFLLLGDGSRLTVGQIQTLPNFFSGVELLVLSASDTALRADSNGREVEGFAVTAQRQGAKAVMATLWPIGDSSNVALMRSFFKHLLEGNSKAEALRKAQLELLHQSSYSHPYYWAPFVLIGNWR